MSYLEINSNGIFVHDDNGEVKIVKDKNEDN